MIKIRLHHPGTHSSALSAQPHSSKIQLANNKLKHGTGTHLEVTSANTNLQRSLLNQLQLEFQVCTAQLELARLSGIRFW
jgi:outer membrane protein TolC